MTTLADLIHQNYSKNPDKTAIILQHAGQDDKPVSYLDLVKGSAQYAQTYAEAGIQPGEVVIWNSVLNVTSSQKNNFQAGLRFVFPQTTSQSNPRR